MLNDDRQLLNKIADGDVKALGIPICYMLQGCVIFHSAC